MTRQLIAVDLDDVLGAQSEALRLFINETYGLSLTAEDYRINAPYWDYYEQVWKLHPDEARKRFDAFLNSHGKEGLPVMEGAIAALDELKKAYDLAIVTARQDTFIDETHRWLDKHFPDTFKRVEFVALWTGDHMANKGAICEQIGAAYLIDDNLDHCLSAAEAGLTAILFGDYGWNHADELPNNVIRIHSWPEVLEYFNERSR